MGNAEISEVVRDLRGMIEVKVFVQLKPVGGRGNLPPWWCRILEFSGFAQFAPIKSQTFTPFYSVYVGCEVLPLTASNMEYDNARPIGIRSTPGEVFDLAQP